jgi:hypothetical protein
VRADLDVPGETRRQARVFAIWAASLLLAVCVGITLRARISAGDELTEQGQAELARSRADRLKVAVLLGLLLPAALTLALHRYYRRGGGHARGIVVDVTSDELRVWGRGYGSRVALPGATVAERLVDVYAGRLGAWRQRRLRVTSATVSGPGVRDLELATLAVASDLDDELRVSGGEGDCIEVTREAYLALRTHVLEAANRPTGKHGDDRAT